MYDALSSGVMGVAGVEGSAADVPTQWWYVASPDGLYRDVRALTTEEWGDLDDANFTLTGFGRGGAAEMRARAHLATAVAAAGTAGRRNRRRP